MRSGDTLGSLGQGRIGIHGDADLVALGPQEMFGEVRGVRIPLGQQDQRGAAAGQPDSRPRTSRSSGRCASPGDRPAAT